MIKTPILSMILVAIASVTTLGQSNIESAQKFSWSENVGWMNWRDANSTGDGVVIGHDFLSGFIWAENAGWINVGSDTGPHGNTTGLDFGVNVLANGDLDGFAWGENLGWVNFGWAAPANSDRPRVDSATGRLRGWAWGENAGWINLDDATHFVAFCRPSSAPQADLIADSTGVLVTSAKNRFLSFSAGDAGASQAIRVTFVDLPVPFDSWNSATLWVGPTSEVSEHGGNVLPVAGFDNFTAATLQCDGPVYMDLGAQGVIHVFHEGIVPGGIYDIQVVNASCDVANESGYSAPLVMTQSFCGDVVGFFDGDAGIWPAPDGRVDVAADVVALLDKFASAPQAPTKARADLEGPGGCVDLRINITDVVKALDAFAGVPYPFVPSADDACASTCPNVLP